MSDGGVSKGDAPQGAQRTEDVLAFFQEVVFRYPVASQAFFRAFVREGRVFAQTPEGKRWAQRLAHSDFVRQGRVVWDSVTLNALDDDEATVFPTAILDAFTKAIASADVHALLSNVLDAGITRGSSDDDAG